MASEKGVKLLYSFIFAFTKNLKKTKMREILNKYGAIHIPGVSFLPFSPITAKRNNTILFYDNQKKNCSFTVLIV
jgi:hypothetical protein